MTKQKIRATVERLEGVMMVLDIDGREGRLPRSVIAGPVVVGDELVLEVTVDHSGAARDEAADGMDQRSRRVGSTSKRGGRNPRAASTRVAKK